MNNFDAVDAKNKVIQWIKTWFDANGQDCNAVIGISSGKDSTVVAALCCEALGKDRVIGVLMPNGTQSDIGDSYRVIRHLGIRYIEVNIANAVDGVINELDGNYIECPREDGLKKYQKLSLSEQAVTNLPARIRMSTLFAIAQCCNGRVSCNCNLSEDYIGYSTFGGDDFGSFAPLRHFTSEEVVAIGDACGLPYELTHKTPSDGLCGKTDEDNFGFTYAVLNKYIRTGECEDAEIKAKIDAMHKKNLFKLMPMPAFNYWEQMLWE